jgi:hypothetical protein
MPHPTVVIPTDFDLTPVGKRRVKVRPSLIRWFVSGRRYHALPITAANIALSREWVANAGAPNHRPQPRSLFQ